MLTKESGAKFFLLSKEETDEPNGTIIKVHLKKTHREMEYMKEAIHKKIVYFDGIHYDGFQNPLVKHETFWFTRDFREVNNNMHIQYNGYYYPIDWNMIQTMAIPIPVAIPFQIGELEVVASREEIQYNFKTIELLKQKIADFITYAQSKIDFNYYDFKKYYKDKIAGAFNLIESLRVTFDSIGVTNKLVYVPLKDLTLKTDLPNVEIRVIHKTRIEKSSQKLSTFPDYELYVVDVPNPLSKKYFRSYMQDEYVLYLTEWKLKHWVDFLCLRKVPRKEWREKIEFYKTWFIKQFKVVLMSHVLKSKEFLDYEETEKKNLQKTKSVTPSRKKVNYVARWANNNLGEVVFDTHLNIDDRPILTVTTETPKAKVRQLFQIAHKKYNIVRGKVEDYNHIESTQLVADVYYSIAIQSYLRTNKQFIRYIENVFPNEFVCFQKLNDFVIEFFPHNLGSQRLENDLLEWVTLHGLKNSMKDVLEECYKVQEKYVYIKLLADVYEYYQYKDEKIKALITFIESIKK